MGKSLDLLSRFDVSTLPDLDVVVFGALEKIHETELPAVPEFERPLVIGSGNAEFTGRILFNDKNAVFGDESNFKKQYATQGNFDGIVVVSASGGKHSVGVIKELLEKGKPLVLLTNNESSPARDLLPDENVIVFPKNREPYTYNTSTYFSMIFSKTHEDAMQIMEFIRNKVQTVLLRDLATYGAYTFIVPPEFSHARAMLRTKFDELFGPKIIGRIFTSEEIKHAKTVIGSGDELFISFGLTNKNFGLSKNRLEIPLPESCKYGAFLAISYFVVGLIQKANPPYFKDSIEDYTKQASELFGQSITPIVE